MSSHCFHPSVGGLETVSQTLAEEFVSLGMEVKLITRTPSTESERWPFEVIRRPSPMRLWNLVKWCDVFFHNNISLQVAWPLLVLRRPWVVAHHIWIARSSGAIAWQDKMKRRSLRFASSISISHAIAAQLPVKSAVIGNPYRATEFEIRPHRKRDRDLVFVGRLVSAKGVNLLIETLAALGGQGHKPSLTIIGRGPEEQALKAQVERLGLEAQIRFTGEVRGDALVELLNAHRIMVIPSLWAEPFGLVALEAIACGCVVVGSSLGGLPDAIGPCGMTYPNGDAEALRCVLAELLDDPAKLESFRAPAEAHLKRFQPAAVAQAYLEIIQEATDCTKRCQ